MKTVAVIGGGITGLCTMHYLQRQVRANNLAVNLVLIPTTNMLSMQGLPTMQEMLPIFPPRVLY